MKKRISAIMLCALMLCSCTSNNIDDQFKAWNESGKAFDFDQNGVIDIEDFKLNQSFEEWKITNAAHDYDNDGEITPKDYLYHLEYTAWLKSDDAADLNNDGKINIIDYQKFTNYSAWKKTNGEDFDGNDVIDYNDYLQYLKMEEWCHSDDKFDYNGDNRIDSADYKIRNDFLAWKKTENAVDYNGDLKVDYNDYKLFKEFDLWKNGDNSFDYNSNNKLDFEDYTIYNWIDSNDAVDYNGDRVINFEDYKLSKTPLAKEYESWVNSGDAYDYDLNSKVDIADWYRFKNFGVYKIVNYDQGGDLDMLVTEKLRLSDLVNFKNGILLDLSGKGLTAEVNKDAEAYLQDNVEALKKKIASLNVSFTTLNTFNVSTSLKVLNKDVDVVLYFEKAEGFDTFHMSYEYIYEGKTMTISMDLLKD